MNKKQNKSNDDQLNEVLAEYLIAIDNGDESAAGRIVEKYPQYAGQIKQFADNKRLIDHFAMTRGGKNVDGRLDATSDASPSGFQPPSVEQLQGKIANLEILELVGCGGMGAVYKARQQNLDRIVALKILPPQVKTESTFAERFMREAKAMAKLSHPNIVTIFECGEADGLFYLTMEFIDGVNLRQAMKRGKLEPEQALTIVPQVCDALYFAHQQGIVHRDIKPENILLDKNGIVKIADFGLAKVMEQASSQYQLTGTMQVLGTMRYMAPEQLEGARHIDHRADIYSLGVVFYELLTGQLPVGRFERPSESARIDARLDEVVLRSLERSPDRRYQQASEIKTDISAISVDSKGPPTVTDLGQNQPDPESGASYFPGTRIFRSNAILIIVGLAVILCTCLIWTTIEITTELGDRSRRLLSQFGASGFKHLLPVFSFLLAIGLVSSTILTINRRFVLWRGILATATGIALVLAASYIVVFPPLTSHNDKYALVAKEIDARYFSNSGALYAIQKARSPGVEIKVVPETASYFGLVLGGIVIVFGWVEFSQSSRWQNRSLDRGSRKKIAALLGTGLQLTGLASFFFALITIGGWIAMQFFGSVSGSYSTWNYGGGMTAFLHLTHAMVVAPLLILAGQAAKNLQQRGFVCLGIGLAILPISYAAAVGLPVAILLFIVIVENRWGSDLFDVELTDGESSRQGIRIAGGVQFVSAMISLIGFMIILGVLIYETRYFALDLSQSLAQSEAANATGSGSARASTRPYVHPEKIAMAVCAVVACALSLLQMMTGYFMMRLRSFRSAWASAIIGLIPFSFMWPVSLPASVWTMFKMRQKFSDGKNEYRSAAFLFEPSRKSPAGK